MKVCTETHHVASFGEIPAGSLWADDSPFVVESDKFAEVPTAGEAAPVKPPLRKFNAKTKGTR